MARGSQCLEVDETGQELELEMELGLEIELKKEVKMCKILDKS